MIKQLTIALLLTSCAANAQYINNNSTIVQTPAGFNVSGHGKAHSFHTIQSTGSGGNGHFALYEAENAMRWALGMNTPETGAGQEGSNFSLYAYGSGGYLGEYLSIRRDNGFMGLGVRMPQARLHVAGNAAENTSIRFGLPHDVGNINVPVGGVTGGYNIDFYTWRDIHPDQTGARLRAERINTYNPNNALVQGMDLAFSTSAGVEPSGLTEQYADQV